MIKFAPNIIENSAAAVVVVVVIIFVFTMTMDETTKTMTVSNQPLNILNLTIVFSILSKYFLLFLLCFQYPAIPNFSA